MNQTLAFIACKSNTERKLDRIFVTVLHREYVAGNWTVISEDSFSKENIDISDRDAFDAFFLWLTQHIDYKDKNDKAFFIAYNSQTNWHHIKNWFTLHSNEEVAYFINNFFYYPGIDLMQTVLQHYLRSGINPKSMKLLNVLEYIHLNPEEKKMNFMEYEVTSIRKLSKLFGLVDSL